MEIIRGSVVIGKAGHERGRHMAVLQCDGRFLWLADGDSRKIGSPKKKNIIHVAPTGTVLEETLLNNDKQLRLAIRAFTQE